MIRKYKILKSFYEKCSGCKDLQRVIFTASQNYAQSEIKTDENVDVKPFHEIPGPKPAPVFGFLWHVMPIFGRYKGLQQYEMHDRLEKEYGKIVLLKNLKFRSDLLLCFDPKDIETIFRNDGQWPKRDVLESIKYYRNTLRKDVFQGYGGVFASDNEEWQEARTIANSLMMQPRVVHKYIDNMGVVADDFIERIRYLSTLDSLGEMPADFSNDLMKWALESVGVLALDTRFGVLSQNLKPNSEEQQFLDDIRIAFDLMYQIDVIPSLSKYISTPTWRKYIGVFDRITIFIQKHVEMTKKKLEKENPNKDENTMSIMEKLIKKYEPKYMFGNIMDILLGGVETTSRTMGAILYNLASNPTAQETLFKEVLSVLPEKNTPLTIDKLESMPYLRAVIKESMRLMPIGLGLSRETTKDMVLSGYHIPKGTSLIIEQSALLWSDEYFANAKEFQPERWLRTDRTRNVKMNPWVYHPFGFGPRSCVGRRLAQLELEVLLPKIIRNFHLEWHHGDVNLTMKLFLEITNPLKIRVKPTSS